MCPAPWQREICTVLANNQGGQEESIKHNQPVISASAMPRVPSSLPPPPSQTSSVSTTMDTPALLPPHVVSLLLSYLSRLDHPLPPHLISTPLRQRHHFLGLGQDLDTVQDAASYLSWPSSSDSHDDTLRMIDLLRSLPSPENFDPLTAYPTKYSFDGEAVYAHVQVPLDGSLGDDAAGLRLVFRWEARDGEGAIEGLHGTTPATNIDNWKYHDARPMPFPPNSHDSPRGALHPEAEDPTPTQSHPSSADQIPASLRSQPHIDQSDSDDDAYWDSYGRSNSDDEDGGVYDYRPSAISRADDGDEKAEDAYWAQYASVHGMLRPCAVSQNRCTNSFLFEQAPQIRHVILRCHKNVDYMIRPSQSKSNILLTTHRISTDTGARIFWCQRIP